MLQCRILHYAKSVPPKSADLNTAQGPIERGRWACDSFAAAADRTGSDETKESAQCRFHPFSKL
jgi:hypothetical protein